jgi:hypothetical protein
LGNNATNEEKGAAALLVVDFDEKNFNGNAVQVFLFFFSFLFYFSINYNINKKIKKNYI